MSGFNTGLSCHFVDAGQLLRGTCLVAMVAESNHSEARFREIHHYVLQMTRRVQVAWQAAQAATTGGTAQGAWAMKEQLNKVKRVFELHDI